MPKSQGKGKKIRFAVVGLGHIAQSAVLPAFAHASRKAELTALVSGDDLKLRRVGRKYGVKRVFRYEEYDALLDSGEIDAVYIALPNSLHAEYSVRALERGVHVLCEKPLALSEDECRRMIRASEENNALLMTAYRLHFEKANLKAIRYAKDKLGDLRYFQSTFSYQLRDPDNIRLEAKEGGNPLWDLGVYCINAARYLFREEPIAVMAIGANGGDERFREVQEMTSVVMKFPGERLASFTCSFGAGDSAVYELVGSKGSLRLENAYEYAAPRSLTLRIGEKSRKFRFKKSDQFAPELLYFADCIRHGRKPEVSGFEGWADVRVILAIEESLRKGRAVALEPATSMIENKARPDLKQWIERPAVREPKVVNAEAPSGD